MSLPTVASLGGVFWSEMESGILPHPCLGGCSAFTGT